MTATTAITARPTSTPPPTMDGVNVLLAGIVGSTAYGLAGPESDVDKLAEWLRPDARPVRWEGGTR